MDVGEKQKYIHYGSSEFDKNRFKPIMNGNLESKPFGGLWASPVDSKWGWSNWCKAEEFRLDALVVSFSFVLTDEAKVLHLKSGSDVDKLPRYNPYAGLNYPCTYIDFEELAKEYDAIEAHLYEDEEQYDIPWQNQLYWKLYTWDCHSILIMNPGIVVPVSGEESN